MTYAAFDLETAKILPEDVEDLHAYRPLGVACGAIVVEGQEAYTYRNLEDDYLWGPRHAQSFITKLEKLVAQGLRLCSWNGLGFDLSILAEEAGWGEWHGRCAALALDHYDLMFQVMCVKGYPVSLDNTCLGLGIAGKLSGVKGSQAPALWAAGEYAKVLAYCAQDTRTTIAVYQTVEELGVFKWITKSGKPNKFNCPDILTVRQAMQLPVPYTGWMESPALRPSFYGWTQQVHAPPVIPETVTPPDDLPFIPQF